MDKAILSDFTGPHIPQCVVDHLSANIFPYRNRKKRKPNLIRDLALEFAKLPRSECRALPNQKALSFLGEEYRRSVNATHSLCTRHDTEKGREMYLATGDVSWSKRYEKKMLRKIEKIQWKSANFGITLTMREEYNISPVNALYHMASAWNVFITALRKHLNKKIRVIRCWEMQGHEHVHCHAVIECERTPELENWIRQEWYCLTGATEVEFSKGGRGASRYITKHLVRSAGGKDGKFLRYLMWSCRVRRWASSRGLINEQPSADPWTWCGFLFHTPKELIEYEVPTGYFFIKDPEQLSDPG